MKVRFVKDVSVTDAHAASSMAWLYRVFPPVQWDDWGENPPAVRVADHIIVSVAGKPHHSTVIVAADEDGHVHSWAPIAVEPHENVHPIQMLHRHGFDID